MVFDCPLSLGVGFCCPTVVFVGPLSMWVLGWEFWVGRSRDEPVGGVVAGLSEGAVSPVDGVSVGALLFGAVGESPLWGVPVGVSLVGFDGVVSPLGGVGLDPLPFGLAGVVSSAGDPVDEDAVSPASGVPVDPLLFGFDGAESAVGGVPLVPLSFGLVGADSPGAEVSGEPFCGVAPSPVGVVDAGFVDPPVSPVFGLVGAFGLVLPDPFGL